jgi:predicted DNA-binding protein
MPQLGIYLNDVYYDLLGALAKANNQTRQQYAKEQLEAAIDEETGKNAVDY